MIQYKYSLTEKNEIVEISQLTVDERTRKYYCLGCGNQLIAKMGAIKEWHFAHKVQVNCSSETYLHRLGKEIFEREYRNCLTNNEPFVLEVPRDIECKKCIDDFNVRCTGSTEIEELDLTKHFDVLEIEKTDNGFRPDIMLINSKSGRRIYVEIAVTHRVEQEKIDLGEVIVEYSIYAEEDLQIIKKRRTTSSNPNIKLFNFVPKTYAYEDLSKTKFCSEYRSYFLVFRSGKSIVIDIPLPEVKNRLLSSPCIYSKIVKSSENPIDIYLASVIEAYEMNVNIKSCFLCRYHAKNESKGRYDFTIFCKFLKQGNDSNYAAECEYFRPDNKVYGFYLSPGSLEEI